MKKTIKEGEAKEPNIRVGMVVQAYGFPMLSGFKGENFYKLMRIEGETGYFRRCNERGIVGNIGQSEFPASIKNVKQALMALDNGVSSNGLKVWQEGKTLSDMKLVTLLPINKLKESVADIKAYRNKSGDTANDSMIRIVLMKKIEGQTAFYRLEMDNWFRRYQNPGKGAGLMIRTFRVTGNKPNYSVVKGGGGKGIPAFPISLSYLPNDKVEQGDDRPENYEETKGWLIYGTLTNPIGDQAMLEFTPKDVETFVKGNISNYQP